VFGTDGPQREPDTVSFTIKEVRKIKSLNLKTEDEENILGRTILEILGI